jgi:Ca-activated chloride channel homolog
MMKLHHVAALSVLGMVVSCLAVGAWAPGRAAAAIDPARVRRVAAPARRAVVSQWTEHGTLDVDGRLDRGRVRRGSSETVNVFVEVRAGDVEVAARAPVAMALVMDRSGSMAGERIARARQAAAGMVERMADGDVVAVIAFDTQAIAVVPPTTLTAASRGEVMRAIGAVAPGGDTCISCGVEQARLALASFSGRTRQVIVLSDGKATAGLRDAGALRRMASEAGMPITTVGVGLDYEEEKLEAMSSASNGRHHFVEKEASLPELFAAEATSLAATVANDAFVELELGEDVRLAQVRDRAFEQRGRSVRVHLGAFSAGETKTVLAEVVVPSLSEGVRAVALVTVSYADLTGEGVRAAARGKLELAVTDGSSAVDPVVGARVERSVTSAALEQVNELLRGGRVEAARELLEAREASFPAPAPAPLPPSAQADLDEQRSVTARAKSDLAPNRRAGSCGCSPGDLACNASCSQKSNAADYSTLKK